MGVSEFRDMAIRSAQLYYDYLERNGKGIAKISVRKITPETTEDGVLFHLRLSARLSDAAAQVLGALFFRFGGRDYTSTEIVPVKYDSSSSCLQVRPKPEFLHSFEALFPQDLTVYSDLKFLVKRVEEWYEQNGLKIALPPPSAPIPRHDLSFSATPSEEQKAAVSRALSLPLSYIWGAPGTGKTRVVLSSCVLTLLSSGRKVLLLAPTNNALEQMLYGVLPTLSDAGISLDTVVRLGLPSPQFSARYPSVCESLNLSRQINSLTSEIERINKCLSFRRSYARFTRHTTQITSLLGQYSSNIREASLVQEDLDSLNQEYKHLLDESHRLQIEEEQAAARKEKAQRALTGFFATVKKWFFPRSFAVLSAQAEAAARELLQVRMELEAVSADIRSTQYKVSACEKQLSSLRDRRAELRSRLLEEASFWPALALRMDSLLLNFSSSRMRSFLEYIHQYEGQLHDLSKNHARYDGQSDDALSEQARQLSQKLEAYLALSSQGRLTKASVVAATIDKFLTLDLWSGPFQPHHIFLDEAGYCPLIKGAAALSLGIPVTLLGDHMQLPPVCEMDDDEIESNGNREISLWAQSAIHLESVFTLSPEQIAQSYLTSAPPTFSLLQRSTLTCTYRFGSALSHILAGCVYDARFHSAFPDGTEVLVLDAPHGTSVKRIAPEEIDAVARYLSVNLPGDDGVAILSPYRNQAAEFSKRFPSLSSEGRVLTVHSSQGREWDTVFFSVTDTASMWFTNSRLPKSKGLQVINTAVSRAKKRLILVCDYDCWSERDDQLIGQLVQAAQHIPQKPGSKRPIH